MTNDYRKGAKYRKKTDANFRLRQKNSPKFQKIKRQKLHDAGIPRSQWSDWVLHHTPKGTRLMKKKDHDDFHRRRGDYNSKKNKSVLRRRK